MRGLRVEFGLKILGNGGQMAGSVNKVILVGNLGRDPEVRFTQDNKKIVNLNLATSDSWKDKNTGEKPVFYNVPSRGVVDPALRKSMFCVS